MDAHKSKVVSLFSGDEIKYFIPVYQRNYSWSTKQCRQLFNDLLSIMENEDDHFFGSIVLFYDRQDTYSIIDGQQRLTTTSLIWLAMSRLIDEGIKESTKTLRQNIGNKFSYPSDRDENILLPKIVHVDKDSKAFEALVKGDKDKFVNDSNMTHNFYLFYEWIKTSKYSIAEFDKAIKRLLVVKIELDAADNPQLIFESLNSTGLALSDGDKIRNFILMNLDASVQKEYYGKYWIDIEKYSNYAGNEREPSNAVTSFVRDFLTAKTARIPAMRDIYGKFKEYANSLKVETILEEMKEYSKYLNFIENSKSNSSKLNKILKRLALLDMTVVHPYILNLLYDYYRQEISEENTARILCAIENFLFRRLICDVPTNSLNKIFATLHGSACRIVEKEQVDYTEVVIYLLTSKVDSGRFPSNTEFRQSLAEKNIYKMRSKNKVYIFYRLNSGYNRESDESIISKMQQEGDDALSIEHIMPQHLSSEWRECLGEKADEIHDRWLHNIANLTLTGYNSSYSDGSFHFKAEEVTDKEGHKVGFRYSHLHINEFVKKQTTWTEKELKERLELLVKEALDIWYLPVSSYAPIKKAYEELNLNDEIDDFTNKAFVDCTIEGNLIPVKENESWKNVLKAIIGELNRTYHFEIEQIANDAYNTILQNEVTKFNNSEEVLPGIYAYQKSSTATKIEILKNLCRYIEFEGDSIVFHVRRYE